MKKKVVIIGCGFAGVFAAKKLCRDRFIEVVVIDKKPTFDFLPLLPDVIGRNINPAYLICDIENISKKLKFKFINDEVTGLELDKNKILFSSGNIEYDYLIIASGSETNFYNNNSIKQFGYKLDSVNDAILILEALKNSDFDNIIVSGGGYTGIEVATNLRRFLGKTAPNKRIIIIEKSNFILGNLPDWVKKYCIRNLDKLGIEILTNTFVKKIDDRHVLLSDDKEIDNAMLIWAAGVKAPDFVWNINREKNFQGRLKVDEYLRLTNNCFVAGDSAYVQNGDIFLRMAVQFAIYQAVSVASNIRKSIYGKELKVYKPFDLGYIIPMVNNKSCGSILGMPVLGLVATFMHFVMCIYRSFGLRNKIGIINSLIKGGR